MGKVTEQYQSVNHGPLHSPLNSPTPTHQILPIPKLLKLPPDYPPSHLPLCILDERQTNPKELLRPLTLMETLEAETKNDIKKEPEGKKKQHTAKREAVKAPKTEARKVQGLEVSEKPESDTKHKHTLEEGRLIIYCKMKARNVEAENWLGTTNPYIRVTVGKKKAIYYPGMSFNRMMYFKIDQNTPNTMNVHFGNNYLHKNIILAHKTLDIKTVQFN